ncbi:Ulp1 protease family protein [Colletotrichum tabaci]|uniref:Ulp1 protease family protein n=1 Tax=Colletotrichum tabaci TaxID=1209068 RepID=A0AAV9THV2_9PEZI
MTNAIVSCLIIIIFFFFTSTYSICAVSVLMIEEAMPNSTTDATASATTDSTIDRCTPQRHSFRRPTVPHPRDDFSVLILTLKPTPDTSRQVHHLCVHKSWIPTSDNLNLTFEKVEAPKQPNMWDCGVYAIHVATLLVAGKEVPASIDGYQERGFLRQRLLTSVGRTLFPDEVDGVDETATALSRHHPTPASGVIS